MRDWFPIDGITRQAGRIRSMSDAELLAAIGRMAPLPDSDIDPAWDLDETTDALEFLLAAADAVGERRLVAGIAPLYALASLDDAFGLMQGVRHGPEAAVDGDFEALTDVLRPLTRAPSAGCRRWAVRELGILRNAAALDDLLASLDDSVEAVREEAASSVGMLGIALDEPLRGNVLTALTRLAGSAPATSTRQAAAEAMARIQAMEHEVPPGG